MGLRNLLHNVSGWYHTRANNVSGWYHTRANNVSTWYQTRRNNASARNPNQNTGTGSSNLSEWCTLNLNASMREHYFRKSWKPVATVVVGTSLVYLLSGGCHRDRPYDKAVLTDTELSDVVGQHFDLYDAGYDINGDGKVDKIVKARPGDKKAYELRQVKGHPGQYTLVEVAGVLRKPDDSKSTVIGKNPDPRHLGPYSVRRESNSNPDNSELVYRTIPKPK